MSFARYPAYRESGVEWLGEIPKHWEIGRLGHYFEERRERVSDTEFPPLSVTKNGVVPQLETAAKTDDNDNRKKVCCGDFVINSRSDRKGSAGLSDRAGSVSLINTVLRPRSGMSGHYAHYLLRSVPFQEEYYRYGKGIVADLWSTSYSEMRTILLAVPPLSDQIAIVLFLDRETVKIDMLVAEQEKLISLLKEKRQVVISHAVTRGLDPIVSMKDTGIEFLGEVPAHWAGKRVKHLLAEIQQGWSPEADDRLANEDEWGVLKTGCVNYGTFRDTEHKVLPHDVMPPEDIVVQVGDVLMSRASGSHDLIGSVAIVRECRYQLIMSDKIFRLVPNSETCSGDFLVWSLTAPPSRMQIKQAISGAEGLANNIPKSSLRELFVALPPPQEQYAIASFLEYETSKIADLISEIKDAIDLLKERRAALISAAVTGKIDVRGVSVAA